MFDRDLASLEDFPAWPIRGSLRILSVVRDSHHDLHMTLGLHVGAHDAEAHQRLTVLRDECGNDGVKRALAGTHLVRMTRLQAEAEAPVMKTDTRIGHDHTGSESVVVRLDV